MASRSQQQLHGDGDPLPCWRKGGTQTLYLLQHSIWDKNEGPQDLMESPHVKYMKYSSLWSPCGIGQTIIFSSCGFFLSFFSLPNLSGRTVDVYHTSTHGVALVRIYNAGLKCAARGSLKIQDAKKSPKIAIWAPLHNFVRLYLCN